MFVARWSLQHKNLNICLFNKILTLSTNSFYIDKARGMSQRFATCSVIIIAAIIKNNESILGMNMTATPYLIINMLNCKLHSLFFGFINFVSPEWSVRFELRSLDHHFLRQHFPSITLTYLPVPFARIIYEFIFFWNASPIVGDVMTFCGINRVCYEAFQVESKLGGIDWKIGENDTVVFVVVAF